jgi:hypothetical protein
MFVKISFEIIGATVKWLFTGRKERYIDIIKNLHYSNSNFLIGVVTTAIIISLLLLLFY